MSTCFQISVLPGCEDIILEELSPSTLLPTLEWSSLPHGSDWVYRQAMQFLQDEFVNIAQSDAFSFIPKKYLAEALKSDFLQVFDLLSITLNEVKTISVITDVSPLSTLPPCITACEVGLKSTSWSPMANTSMGYTLISYFESVIYL